MKPKILLELLVTPSGCNKCGRAKEKISHVLQKFRDTVFIKEIDITKDPTKLVRFGLMTVPALLINGKLACVGIPDEKKLREKIARCLP